ncbi:MAG: radical SAM protein [Bacteroidia bacterium]|nr:radical SAM protein [Bacteroidia bacterium]
MNRGTKAACVQNSRIHIVSGLKLAMVRIGAVLTILILSLKINPNPFKAVRLLRSLIRERVTIHGNEGGIKAVKAGKKYFWSTNVPGWPSEAFNHFIYNEFQRIHSPLESHLQTIFLGITNVCPLNCIHCFESENLSDKDNLSLEELVNIMEKINNHGIRHIHLSGGEPLSRFDDMIELLRFSGNTKEFWINTSGFGLTREKAFVMKQNGITGAIISLDDWDEKKHNAFRKNDKSYFWVKEAVRNCNEAGIIVCLALCCIREFATEENLDRYLQLAKEMGAVFVRIMEPVKVGRFSGKDVQLDQFQIGIIDRFMLSRNSDPAYAGYPIIQFPGHHQRRSGCQGAGNRYLYIDSNGQFHSCPFCRKPLGNALTESLDFGIAQARAAGCHLFQQRTLA